MNRREFLITVGAGAVMVMMRGEGEGSVMDNPAFASQRRKKTRVSLIKSLDREAGIKRAIKLLGINPVMGMDVLLKPNFNTADPFPGSTHNDTLTHLILQLQTMGAKSITLGERSGPPDTADVMKEKGIYELCDKLGVNIIDFEHLPATGWVHFKPEQSHWLNGFDIAKPLIDSSCIVTTCCLKTHGYGGVFTMSLKLSVGVTHKRNMRELHTSFLSMRKMIAEINQAYSPSLILLDGIEAFVDKGPSHGPVKQAGAILAGTDRIAIDAVGLSILKKLGSNKAIMDKKIFEQEQISRAVELGLGVSCPEDIEIVSDDAPGREYAEELMQILLKG
ncbi:MAG TPA: DUF362 domain-containing protein [Nitrospirota bacterium]|nr:DUF362 domain-containing protein [Nitrospirota bacterium]